VWAEIDWWRQWGVRDDGGAESVGVRGNGDDGPLHYADRQLVLESM